MKGGVEGGGGQIEPSPENKTLTIPSLIRIKVPQRSSPSLKFYDCINNFSSECCLSSIK